MNNSARERIINRVLDFIIYGSFLTVVIWGILKGAGVINTPDIIQQIPIITGGLGLLGFAYKVGRFVEHVEQRFRQHELKFNHLDKDVELIRSDVSFVKQRV
jgi:hypothetical protein